MVQGARKQVLACEPDPAELHSLLSNLAVLGQLSVDELCQEATTLLKQNPPDKLAAKAQLKFMWYACTAMLAVSVMPRAYYHADVVGVTLLYTQHTMRIRWSLHSNKPHASRLTPHAHVVCCRCQVARLCACSCNC